MTIKAKKDLFMEGSKSPSFTKGTEYQVLNTFQSHLHNHTKVIDDQGDEHYLGIFFTQFKITKQ